MPTGDPPFGLGVIDYGQYDRRHIGCQCPRAWWGVLPPPCPVHNPSSPTFTLTNTAGTAPLPLSDEDVERIAERVAEKLRERR